MKSRKENKQKKKKKKKQHKNNNNLHVKCEVHDNDIQLYFRTNIY